MRKIYDIFVELCIKYTRMSAIKGSNYYKNTKKHVVLESSRKCANSLMHPKLTIAKRHCMPLSIN